MRHLWLVCIALLVVLALPTPTAAQFPVNVLQDCWTNEMPPPIETETYFFPAGAPIRFVWKQKVMVPCSSYVVRIIGQRCRNGKPRPVPPPLFDFFVPFGPISPDPTMTELLFEFTPPPGSIPPGVYDWFMFAECDDTTGFIPLVPDGDIDDECGINVGRQPIVPGGPLILGPEPVEVLDPDPGGFPPGRMPGEEGTTRPWCFTVM